MFKNNNNNSNNNNTSNISTGNGSSNIFVAIRVRPETEEEINDRATKTVVRVVDSNVITLDTVSPPSIRLRQHSQNDSEQRFIFDRVFDQFATQKEVFENTTKDVIKYVVNGFNATVFAYGATGAGKTHTMIGNEKSGPGVMVLTMRDLFEEVEKNNNKLKISMSYLEIYNENIYDLLVNDSKPLGLREDASRQVVVADLTERYPTSSNEVFKMLEFGNTNRKQSPTNVNKVSSRSHAILQVFIRSANTSGNVTSGKLSLIDLAGSERAAKTMNRGVRLVEGANINKSLLSLANCINALAGKPGQYIPYRDSKLTRILKDSLGGNCKTVMIANISPNSTSYEETHNTLVYANRAKDIKTRVAKNVLNVNTHLSQYTEIIKELREEIRSLKYKLSDRGEIEASDMEDSNNNNNHHNNSMNGSTLMDSTFDDTYVNQISDEINQNLNETLNLKKMQSCLDDQAEQIQSAMDNSRSIINTFLNDPDKAEIVKELKEEYLQKKQELQSIETKQSEIQVDLNEKDTWRKKLQLDLPSNIKCQKYQNYLIQQARAASLELDRWDISDKFLKQNKSQQERINEMAQLEKNHCQAIDVLYSALTEGWRIINDNVPNTSIPVEFVNNFLICSKLRNRYMNGGDSSAKKLPKQKQQQHQLVQQQLNSSQNEDQQSPPLQQQKQQPVQQKVQQQPQPVRQPKSILKKTPAPAANLVPTLTKKRVLDQDSNSPMEEQPRVLKKPTLQSNKPGSRTILEAIQVSNNNQVPEQPPAAKPVRQLRPLGISQTSVQLKRIPQQPLQSNPILTQHQPIQPISKPQPTNSTKTLQPTINSNLAVNGNTDAVKRVKFNPNHQPPTITPDENNQQINIEENNNIDNQKTLRPMKTRIIITKKVPTSLVATKKVK
ncbi:kinesin family member 10 [Heterostelium album PN500]|uniref:Kinesin-like protein n=1 Tax=Heterostelium pallidum (strain ATCC 26659 / Pp 5 / PN500) TaxID=670386 RepID=D3BAL5_HETP5|nr:kinesin family member 10 [Heterostelium album PN500]EFA81602.1 kinesin family member 10 [Heterostelium album PN500]|eukprot:XP_020433719.1 kinesin family member 10 [Heterostelium album PN500]